MPLRITDEAYLRGQARRYRLLAETVRGERAQAALLRLADDFEDRADSAAAPKPAGDPVVRPG